MNNCDKVFLTLLFFGMGLAITGIIIELIKIIVT